MKETSTITSPYFGTRFAIHEKNIHMPASQKNKLTLVVNVVQDNVCGLIYVGNIVDVCSRWAQTKKACLNENSVKISASADGGPRSRVPACGTLRSALHRH